MPRAPHSSTLLAGKPGGEAPVLSSRMSRTRSIPRNSPISTRFTASTGSSAMAVGMPDKGVGGAEIDGWRRRRSETFERIGDPPQQRLQIRIGHNGNSTAPSGRKGGGTYHTPRRESAARNQRARPAHCSLTGHRVPIRRRHSRAASCRSRASAARRTIEARMPMLISTAYAQGPVCQGCSTTRDAAAVPAAGADLCRLLFPVDPAAAEEGEGAPGDARRRCDAATGW